MGGFDKCGNGSNVYVIIVPRIANNTGDVPTTYSEQLQETRQFAEYLRDGDQWYSGCGLQVIIVHDLTSQTVSSVMI